MLQGARESVFTTKADHSFFTEPVSCLVFNAVGKTNVSILVDVHCESPAAPLHSPASLHHGGGVGVGGTNQHLRVSFCVSSRSNPVGGAAAQNGGRGLGRHPQLQMGWEPSAHTDLVQEGFKHGQRLHLKASFLLFFLTREQQFLLKVASMPSREHFFPVVSWRVFC